MTGPPPVLIWSVVQGNLYEWISGFLKNRLTLSSVRWGKQIDLTLAWLRSIHQGRPKNVLSAHTIAEFI